MPTQPVSFVASAVGNARDPIFGISKCPGAAKFGVPIYSNLRFAKERFLVLNLRLLMNLRLAMPLRLVDNLVRLDLNLRDLNLTIL